MSMELKCLMQLVLLFVRQLDIKSFRVHTAYLSYNCLTQSIAFDNIAFVTQRVLDIFFVDIE